MSSLRLAWRRCRDEWAVRPTWSTVLSVIVVPVVMAAFVAFSVGDLGRIVELLLLVVLGWHVHRVWLTSGKVVMVHREWLCRTCGDRGRIHTTQQGRVAFAEHLREVHGVEATPDEIFRHEHGEWP